MSNSNEKIEQLPDTLEPITSTRSDLPNGAEIDLNTDIRPRVGTFAGTEISKTRIRTISHQEYHLNGRDSKHQQNMSLSRIKIGSLISTESGFGSYMVLPLCTATDNELLKEIISGKKSTHSKRNERDSETGECVDDLLRNNENVSKDKDSCENEHDRTLLTESWLSWYTLGICSLLLVILGINWMAFPVFYVHLTRQFSSTQLSTGIIGSLQNAVSQILGLVVSGPIQLFGCKPVAIIGSIVTFIGLVLSSIAPDVTFLYFSFGVVSGAGLSMMSLPCFILIQQHFNTNRSIATAVSMMGFSVGQIIGPVVLDKLIAIFGWRGAMLLFAGIVFHGVPLSMLLIQPPMFQTKKTASTKEVFRELIKKTTDFSLFKNVSFTLFCFGFFLVKFNIMGYYQHLSSRMVHLGFSTTSAATLLTITAICSATNRFISGLIGNMKCSNRTLMYTVTVLIGGIDTCLLPFATSYTMAALICGVYGACLGTIMLMVSIVLVDLLGVENITRSTGLFNVFSGVAGLLATPFSGFLFDISNNYDIPFYVIGTMGFSGGLLSLLVILLESRKTKTTDFEL